MKAKLTAAEHAALDPTLQGEYTAAEDGTFNLFGSDAESVRAINEAMGGDPRETLAMLGASMLQ